jgi:transporter family-2 protein
LAKSFNFPILKTQHNEKWFTSFYGYLHDPSQLITKTGGRMIWLLLFVTLAAGMLLPIQTGINAQLRTVVGHPILAAFIQFVVGAAVLIVVFAATGAPFPQIGKLSSAPWWIWTGGLFGANYIVVAILAGPRLGAGTLLAVTVLGQMLISLVLDHFGWLGFPVHPINAWRIAGAILLLAGVGLIQRF